MFRRHPSVCSSIRIFVRLFVRSPVTVRSFVCTSVCSTIDIVCFKRFFFWNMVWTSFCDLAKSQNLFKLGKCSWISDSFWRIVEIGLGMMDVKENLNSKHVLKWVREWTQKAKSLSVCSVPFHIRLPTSTWAWCVADSGKSLRFWFGLVRFKTLNVEYPTVSFEKVL